MNPHGPRGSARRPRRPAGPAMAREEPERARAMNPGTLRISTEPDATSAEIAVVREGLHRFNFDATRLATHYDITLFVRDGRGAIRGGLLGYVWAEWLHISELWLTDECRGQGIGGRLLQKAERVASLVGARGAFLSTFDFQAPGFYAKQGYEVYATLEGYPPGHAEHHMRKVFDPS